MRHISLATLKWNFFFLSGNQTLAPDKCSIWMALKCGWWCPLEEEVAYLASIYLIEWNFFLSLSLSLSLPPLAALLLTKCTATTDNVAVTSRKAKPPAMPAIAAVETTMLPDGGRSAGASYVTISEGTLFDGGGCCCGGGCGGGGCCCWRMCVGEGVGCEDGTDEKKYWLKRNFF